MLVVGGLLYCIDSEGYVYFELVTSILLEGEVRDDLHCGQLKENSPFLFRGLNVLPHDLQTQ